MFFSNYTYQIVNNIVKACPYYREKFELWDGPAYSYYEDGRDLLFRFVYLNMDIHQFEIVDGGSSQLTGSEVVINSTTWIPYSSQNIFYEPVPFEFMYTNEVNPQVIVSVDGLEAVCDSLDCGFRYIEPTSNITDFSLSGNLLTITGENLTDTIVSVSFSNVPCTNVVQTGTTSITCTVIPVAGSW